MAEFNEIGLIRDATLENVDTQGNIFVFDQIRLGGTGGPLLGGTEGSGILSLTDGSDVSDTLHNHDTIYYRKSELNDTSATPGASLIGTDSTYSWTAISPSSHNADELFKLIDTALGNISSEFSETNFRITQDGDPTAKMAVDVSAISTGVVRTLTMPDQDVNLGNIVTTDEIDDRLSTAISGLSPKGSVNAATISRDWNPTEQIAFINVNLDGTAIHNQWVRLFRPNGDDYVFYFNNTGAAITPPATGVGGTFEVAVLPGDTSFEVAPKLASAVNSNVSSFFAASTYPSNGIRTEDAVRIDGQETGLTDEPTTSDPVGIEINNLDYELTFTRGLDGVGLSFVGGLLTVTGMRTNFLGTQPEIDFVTLDVDFRILVKDIDPLSADAIYNGIWRVTQILSPTSVELERPEDADGLSGFPETNVTSEIKNGVYTFVTDGQFNAGTGFIQIAGGLAGINVNLDPQEWTQFQSAKQFTSGNLVQVFDDNTINLGPLTENEMIMGGDDGQPLVIDTSTSDSDILADVFLIGPDPFGRLRIKDGVISDVKVATGSNLEESVNFFGATDISGAEAETLTDGSNADALHTHSTTNVSEGTNLYFTEARVRGTVLTGLNTSLAGSVAATDSVLQAFGKLQNQLDNTGAITDLTGEVTASGPGSAAATLDNDSVINKTLTAYSAGAGTVSSTDSILQAIQKLDGNIQGLTTSDVPEGSNLYYTTARFDSDFSTKTTSDLAEGTNLYYTQARFDSAFGNKDTDALAEGVTNLYYTDERVDDRVAALIQDGTGITWTYDDVGDTLTGNVSLSSFTTDDLAEGATNLYLTAGVQTIDGAKTFSGAATFDNTVTLNEAIIQEVANIAALDIDWSSANVHEKDISADSTFTFSNDVSGQTIIVKITNTDASAHTADFPAGVQWSGGTAVNNVPANSSNVYTFIRVGTVIYASAVDNLS